MPRQMKDSGIEWIGDIPRNWNIGKVSYFFDVQLGKMLQPVQASEDETLEYYLCAANVGKNKIKVTDLRKMWFSPAEKEALKVQKGDLLVVEGGDVASCDIMEEETNDLFFQNALHRVRPKDTTDIRILKYILWLAKSSGHIDLICNKATIAHFSKDKFRSLPVVVMPLDEQRHVADYLDLQCARIDSVLEQTRSSIEEYKKLKQAVVTQAVTKGVRGDRAMKDSEVEWLGNIPAEWNVYRIANLYDERSESGLEELPILTVSINTGVSDYEIADEDRDRVFVRSEDRTKYKRVYPGDLAYNMMRAWQGAFGAVRVDGMVSPAYVVAKPKKNVELDSRYMEALLRTSEATEEMHRYSRGIVDFRLRLYWPEFKNIRICLPSIEEQIEIADYIDEKVVAIDALITKKEAFAVELENYKKSMIYEYVTGKKGGLVMAFEELSPNAEKLLQEIIEHRLPNGCCDSKHWKNRFENLSFDEDTRIRSLFKELREQEMISVQWADNYPYFLVLLDKGYSYKDNKKAYTKEKRKLSRREWKIAIVSAIIGGIIGLIPSIVQWSGGL